MKSVVRNVLGMDGSMVGLSLNYAITLMMLFQWGVRQSIEVESLVGDRNVLFKIEFIRCDYFALKHAGYG